MKLLDRESWSRIRKRGKWHFVLVRGVLGWGMTMSALALVASFLNLRLVPVRGGTQSIPELLITTALPIFAGTLLLGFGWGIATWHWSEYLFRRDAR